MHGRHTFFSAMSLRIPARPFCASRPQAVISVRTNEYVVYAVTGVVGVSATGVVVGILLWIWIPVRPLLAAADSNYDVPLLTREQ